MDILMNIITFVVAMLVTLSFSSISASSKGLSLSYIIQVTAGAWLRLAYSVLEGMLLDGLTACFLWPPSHSGSLWLPFLAKALWQKYVTFMHRDLPHLLDVEGLLFENTRGIILIVCLGGGYRECIKGRHDHPMVWLNFYCRYEGHEVEEV